jgi:hypothetical protein
MDSGQSFKLANQRAHNTQKYDAGYATSKYSLNASAHLNEIHMFAPALRTFAKRYASFAPTG